MFINQKKGFLQDYITQIWVKITGKSILIQNNMWLFGPTGDSTLIGDSYIYKLAEDDNLTLEKDTLNSGLIDNFKSLNSTLPHQSIIDFYEHTSNYNIDVKVKWMSGFRPFSWLLKLFFSKRLQQLNLPTSNKAFTKGLESSIIKLKDGPQTVWTIWHRKSIALNEVIFSGMYTTCVTPDLKTKMKVIFPLPNGSATVLFTITSIKNGKFELESNGRKIGESGFYFIVNNNKSKKWVRFVKSMHEKLTVDVDENNQVFAFHHFKFWKITFLELKYTMTLKST